MSNNENTDYSDAEYVFPEEEKLVYRVDIPVNPHAYSYDRIPSGYEPMGEIELRGRSYRSLASGRMPLWVLVGGWLFLGFPALGLSILILISGGWTMLPLFLMANIIPWILWRGTQAHFTKKKKRHR
ncbi:hypothetical protein Lepto7376_1622 [[Leptolyngbya] sp. PCC 7376]|uniref:hypothetical protein n=1 Tax=[Leptolyngbya] sp. PCC 7376 TaxID=111781 RepID=UPI00029EDC63|nr:hypothetical protein [[Leptolyngbya] sp. PCC 7376]AFY37958.1 hypothetical protein Lepto7376_1622 [[Leptolyngbya] sp. PCC 7376]